MAAVCEELCRAGHSLGHCLVPVPGALGMPSTGGSSCPQEQLEMTVKAEIGKCDKLMD